MRDRILAVLAFGSVLLLFGPAEARTPGSVASVQLRDAEHVRIWIEARQSGRVRVVGPDGRLLRVFRLSAGVTAPLSFVAQDSGSHHFELDSQVFLTRLEEPRPLADSDGSRLALELRFLRAANAAHGFRGERRRQSIPELRSIVGEAERAGDRRLAAEGLVALGSAYRTVGRASEAIVAYGRALSRSGSAANRIDAHLGAALAFVRLDERDVAQMHAREAVRLATESGSEWRRGRALTALGRSLQDRSKLDEELKHYAEALEVWKQQRDLRSLAETTFFKAVALSDGSREAESLECHEEVLAILETVDDPRLLALELTGLGHSYANLGLSGRAFRAYVSARAPIEEMGDPFWTASLFGGLAFAHAELGDPARAVEFYERAAAENREADSASGEMANLTMMARSLVVLGSPEDAVEALMEALELVESAGDLRGLPILLSDIAALDASLGDHARSQGFYRRTIATCREPSQKRQCAVAFSALAGLMEQKAEYGAARQHYEEAYAASHESRAPFASIEALMGLARLDRRAGELRQALSRTEEAIGIVESLRASLDSYRSRSRYFATARALHELHMNVLFELHQRSPAESFDRIALEAGEMARARSFVEELSVRRPVAGSTGRETASIDEPKARSMDALLEDVQHVRGLNINKLALEEWGAVERRLTDIEIERILSDRDIALVSYFLGAERSFAWSVSLGQIRMFVLPPKTKIEKDATALYRTLSDHEMRTSESAKEHASRVRQNEKRFRSVSRRLSDTLLAPVEASLGSRRLYVVGDGALHTIPFAALADPAHRPEYVPLIEHRDVVRLPSVASIALLRAGDSEVGRLHPNPRLAVVADPVFEGIDPRISVAPRAVRAPLGASADASASGSGTPLRRDRYGYGTVPRLLASRHEARTILELVPEEDRLAALGFQANREILTTGELDGYDIVHLATHGLYSNEHPSLSGVLFSLFDERGRPRDGFLGVNELRSVRLDARLVVLSACRTGLGEEIVGEGPMGLVRAFFAAGARGVVASYWSVDDEATAELMKRFYIAMLKDGLDPARALAAAQRDLHRQARFRSPYYWAGFEIHGTGE